MASLRSIQGSPKLKELLRTWSAHLSAIECLSFGDDDSFIFSGGHDGLVNVWAVVRQDEIGQDPPHCPLQFP